MANKRRGVIEELRVPTDEEVAEIRRQDAERYKDYLTAQDFERMYGNDDKKRLDTTRDRTIR